MIEATLMGKSNWSYVKYSQTSCRQELRIAHRGSRIKKCCHYGSEGQNVSLWLVPMSRDAWPRTVGVLPRLWSGVQPEHDWSLKGMSCSTFDWSIQVAKGKGYAIDNLEASVRDPILETLRDRRLVYTWMVTSGKKIVPLNIIYPAMLPVKHNGKLYICFLSYPMKPNCKKGKN